MLDRIRFYTVVAGCGGILMALEILSSRVLAPHFGNSVYVWGSIISVFLAALSGGYLWGGWLADRRPTIAALGRTVSLAAACQGLLLLFGLPLTAWMGERIGGHPAGPLIAAAVLFGPASVLLATVSPYAVKLAARDLDRLGNTSGALFALSTLGSLAGTLACTFLLIPFLDLRQALALLTALTAAAALAAIAGGWRQEGLSAGLAGLILVFALFHTGRFSPKQEGLLYERITPYQTLQVREKDGTRILESDRVLQTVVRMADGQPILPYPRAAAAAWLLNPKIERMLVLGLGGGSVGVYLQKRFPLLHIDYVDIDPEVPVIAERFLRFRPGPRTRVAVADGRRFLQDSQERWDFIYCDTYIGLSVPFHLTTVEFLDEVSRHLEPGGVFGLNLAAGLADAFSWSMYRTVNESFANAYAFHVPGAPNALVLADQAAIPRSPAELAARAVEFDRKGGLEMPLAEIVAGRLTANFGGEDVPVLTDGFAPVDRLIRLGETR